MKKYILLVVILALFSGCKGFLCGKLDDEHQKMIDSVNAIYCQSFEVRNIPCDQIYLNLHLRTENLDSTQIDEAHKILYHEILSIGWQTINIYNKNNEYIGSHSWRGKFYFPSSH